MLFCDVCNAPIQSRRDIRKRIDLPYEYSCSAWQHKEFDLCDHCERFLLDVVNQAKSDFVNGKISEDEFYERTRIQRRMKGDS